MTNRILAKISKVLSKIKDSVQSKRGKQLFDHIPQLELFLGEGKYLTFFGFVL